MSTHPDRTQSTHAVRSDARQPIPPVDDFAVDDSATGDRDTHTAPHAAYKIGAVARLTGITTHTLRKWQDRYGIVQPERTRRGDRLYTRDDVKKLMAAKDLVDAGMAIARVASMTARELETASEEMFSQGRRAGQLGERAGHWGVSVSSSPKVRLAVVGPAPPGAGASRSDARSNPERLDVKVASIDAAQLLAVEDCPPVDVLVWEIDSLQFESRQTLETLMAHAQATAAIVVYGIGEREHVAALRTHNIAFLRGPVDAQELQRVALGLLCELGGIETAARTGAGRTAEVAPPRYSTETLVRVANSSPKLVCECPTHAAELIMRLGAFEDYAAYCETLNEEDAALHLHLNRTAGQARVLFEDALTRLAKADGISLEPE
ncbi:MAG: MerR family transcriptional regulator [Gammaproteobacteria bacterium]